MRSGQSKHSALPRSPKRFAWSYELAQKGGSEMREIPVEEVLKTEQETHQDVEGDGVLWIQHYITVRVIGGFRLEDATIRRAGSSVEIHIVASR